MDPNQLEALRNIEQAREALSGGDKLTARQFAVRAAELAPELEEVWLLMASLAAPRASLEFLSKALEINPVSPPAQEAFARAMEHLRHDQEQKFVRSEAEAVIAARQQSKNARKRRIILFVGILVGLIFLIGAVLFWSQVNPVSALFSSLSYGTLWSTSSHQSETGTSDPEGVQVIALASLTPVITLESVPAILNLPTFTPTAIKVPTATETEKATEIPSATPTWSETPTWTVTSTWSPTLTETLSPTEEASPTPLPTDTVEPTLEVYPTPVVLPTQLTAPGGATTGVAGGKHWVDVDLTNQMVYAYEGNTLVNSFLVSTGAQPRLTVTGSYHVYERHFKGNMWGPGYFLPDVPYIMYFYKGYALHGTYWHSNFGTPMSHGCVNLSIPDAEWLYNWSSLDMLVKVHY